MLDLQNPRWNELHPFFGSPADVPRAIAEWLLSIGFDQEEVVYARDLQQLFLHQATISDVAFAVVPWLVEAATNRCSSLAIQYISDVAMIEMNRRERGTYWPKGVAGQGSPDWLASDYQAAIQAAQPLAEDLIDSENRDEWRDMLWQLMPALFGRSDLAAKRRKSGERCPAN